MHIVARVLAVAYVVLAAFGSIAYVQMSANYINVTELAVNFRQHVGVGFVEIAWSGNTSQDAIVTIWVNATNPGKVTIEVLNVEFQFHIDDPDDARPWDDRIKLEETRIRPGGFNYGRGQGFLIEAGESRSMPSLVPIEAGTVQMDRFDRADADGRYHPIVWFPRLVYTFPDFDMVIQVQLPPYYDAKGVVPTG